MENIILLKPLQQTDIDLRDLLMKLNKIEFQILKLSKDVFQNKIKQIKVSNSDGVHFLDLKEIIQIKAEGNYCYIILNNGTPIMLSKTLKYIHNLLPKTDFIRTHQSHIINQTHINKLTKKGGWQITMKNGDLIPISRSERKNFLEALESHRLTVKS